jgi:hypothetical protein
LELGSIFATADYKRRGDDITTSVLRLRVTCSNISAKWCGVACIAQLHSVKRTREPNQTVGGSVPLRGRGTQKEKGRVCKALFDGSIPSRASTLPYASRLYRPYFSRDNRNMRWGGSSLFAPTRICALGCVCAQRPPIRSHDLLAHEDGSLRIVVISFASLRTPCFIER